MAADVIDIGPYLKDPCDPQARRAYKRMVEQAEHQGVYTVYDPRFPRGLDVAFRDLMVAFYRLSEEEKKQYEISNHQSGWTPGGNEKARDHSPRFKGARAANRPRRMRYEADPKERYFIPPPKGHGPEKTRYPGLNPRQIVPKEFPQWQHLTGEWRSAMIKTIVSCLEMMAVGLKMPANAFTKRMARGPHLLAATGSRITPNLPSDDVLAAVHYDMNALTGHGKSNCSGLYAWTRDLKRFPVRVPDEHLLMQVGFQLWYLTGGFLHYGLHEVVVTDEALDRVKHWGVKEFWRVSSTLFYHMESDRYLYPIGPFANRKTLRDFPRWAAGNHVQWEINEIGLVLPNKAA